MNDCRYLEKKCLALNDVSQNTYIHTYIHCVPLILKLKSERFIYWPLDVDRDQKKYHGPFWSSFSFLQLIIVTVLNIKLQTWNFKIIFDRNS